MNDLYDKHLKNLGRLDREETSLRGCKTIYQSLQELFSKETNPMINLNKKVIFDGLDRIIVSKKMVVKKLEEEIENYVDQSNSEENK